MFKQPVLSPLFVPRSTVKQALFRAFAIALFFTFSGSIFAQSAGQFLFTAKAYTVTEKQGSAIITVTRQNGAQGKVQVDYMTSDNTATNGVDYELLSGAVTIPSGAHSAPIIVTPVDDDLVEGPESVVIALEQPPIWPPPYIVSWPSVA